MKIFLQPEIRYDEDYQSAEEIKVLLEEDFLQHGNIAESCIEVIILDGK